MRGNKDFLENSEILETLWNYYESHVYHHQLENGNFVAVTKEGWIAPEDGATEDFENLQYVDYARNTLFSLNVKTGHVQLVKENHTLENETIENLKQEIFNELNDYIEWDYRQDATLATIFIDGTDDLTIRICLSCHNLNLQNYWGGEWISTFDVNHTLGTSEFSVVGRIKINNHYFESGNI